MFIKNKPCTQLTGYSHSKEWKWTLTSYHIQKMNSKWNKNINIKAETIKLLEENTGTSLNDLGLGNTFSDMIPKS